MGRKRRLQISLLVASMMLTVVYRPLDFYMALAYSDARWFSFWVAMVIATVIALVDGLIYWYLIGVIGNEEDDKKTPPG